ncbi:hypothetical protein TNCV_2976581 [Trichonephila clavipes]|nr:hypothetical protein TNCV_2976581 [Trichonephila clavipes]
MRGEGDGGVTSGSECAARLEGFSGRHQIWAVRLRVKLATPNFDEIMLSNPNPAPSSRPTRHLKSSFHKPLPYYNFDKVTAALGSSTITTEL